MNEWTMDIHFNWKKLLILMNLKFIDEEIENIQIKMYRPYIIITTKNEHIEFKKLEDDDKNEDILNSLN